MRPKVGSLFSGAAGMTRGFELAGFDPRWHAEVDKDASSVLRRHYRDMPNLGNVQEVHGGRIEPVDVMEGGSPCQDVSQAGNRAGLEGKRSSLFFEYVRIAREMREATNGRYPAVLVLENVDGLLSSNHGRDFAVVLGRLQELGAAVAYRVLDAQFFGVPQRRRRVFVVADFAPVGIGEERAAQVLALRDGMCGHPAPGDETGQGLAVAAQDGPDLGGEPIVYQCQGTNVGPLGTIRAGNGHLTGGVPFVLEPLAFGGNNCSGPIDVATACLADGWHGDFESETFIVAPWDEAQITSATNRASVEDGAVSPTLNGHGQVSIVAAQVASTVTGEYGQSAYRGDGSDNLIAEALAFDWQAGESGNDQSFRGGSRKYICRAGDYAGAIGVTRQDAVAVAFQDSQSETRIGGCIGTLDSNYGSRRRMGIFEHNGMRWIVRRLTPREGERLQGWPDDWTRWRHDGQQISDSARWRLIGNGVATPVARWIAERLMKALERTS